MMIILIDNGHGEDTAGKCSPDGRLREYRFAREIAKEVVSRLRAEGYDARRVVTEERDISLSERARRINEICGRYGRDNVCLVSIHSNAAGSDGKWHFAGGWSGWTSPGKTKGDELAECLYDAAEECLKSYCENFERLKKECKYTSAQKAIRTDMTDGDRDYEAKFYMLTKTKCAACLTENMFQDTSADVDYLLSAVGREEIVDLHVKGLKRYIEKADK
jgi:N-acetylmuramoyl-L-alanine amidase